MAPHTLMLSSESLTPMSKSIPPPLPGRTPTPALLRPSTPTSALVIELHPPNNLLRAIPRRAQPRTHKRRRIRAPAPRSRERAALPSCGTGETRSTVPPRTGVSPDILISRRSERALTPPNPAPPSPRSYIPTPTPTRTPKMPKSPLTPFITPAPFPPWPC